MSAGQDVVLPKFGMQMVDATIEEWIVDDGATVEQGDPIAAISTDKVNADIEAPCAGTLSIVVAAGETVDVGTVLARIS